MNKRKALNNFAGFSYRNGIIKYLLEINYCTHGSKYFKSY